jgi:hypothetical protein
MEDQYCSLAARQENAEIYKWKVTNTNKFRRDQHTGEEGRQLLDRERYFQQQERKKSPNLG